MSGNRKTGWRPPPLIVASLILHGFVLLMWVVMPHHWQWWLGVVLLNHGVVTGIGMWPRSRWLGSNWTHLPGAVEGHIALTIDDGPDPQVTPRVLDLLDHHAVKATFFCIGDNVKQHPQLCREMVARGHDLQNHTQRHSTAFAFSGLQGYRREIAAAQTTLAEITGSTPRFFRAPAGIRSPLLEPVLHGLGLQLVSWTRRGFDTRCADPARVSRRLFADLRPGAILLLHDGHAAHTREGTPVIVAVLPGLLTEAKQRGLRWVTLSEAIKASEAIETGEIT